MNKLAWSLFAVAVLAGCSRSAGPPAPGAASSAAGPAAEVPAPATEPEPAPVDLQSRLVRQDSPVMGPANAAVTIVEFLDPACEACRAFAPVVKQIQFMHPNEVRVVARFADFHPGSDEAIRILLAAKEQGRFETVLAALLDGQEQWAAHHSPNVAEAWKIAIAAGLNEPRARKTAASDEITRRLREEAEDIVALQVSRTPTFYVNGKLLENFGAEPLMTLVNSEVKKSTAP